MEEGTVIDQVRGVGAPWHVAVHGRVQAAGDLNGRRPEVQNVTRAHNRVARRQALGRCRGAGIDVQERAGVRGQQAREPA
jgi:hypothetical protein